MTKVKELTNVLLLLLMTMRHWDKKTLTISTLPTDPWCDSSYERPAFARALRLYRQEKGCYESWEMLLGSEEQVSTHTHTSDCLCLCFINCVFARAGAGLPGDGGSVTMVTESASVQSKGQEDRKNTTVAGSESLCDQKSVIATQSPPYICHVVGLLNL